MALDEFGFCEEWLAEVEADLVMCTATERCQPWIDTVHVGLCRRPGDRPGH